jgi:hypothetical protein
VAKQDIVKLYGGGMVKLHERSSSYIKLKFSFPLRETLPLQKQFPVPTEKMNGWNPKPFWM